MSSGACAEISLFSSVSRSSSTASLWGLMGTGGEPPFLLSNLIAAYPHRHAGRGVCLNKDIHQQVR
jgi:hypothetical protein